MIHPKSKELELPEGNWVNGHSWPQEQLSDCDGSSTVEHGTVAPETVGSSPILHPNLERAEKIAESICFVLQLLTGLIGFATGWIALHQ